MRGLAILAAAVLATAGIMGQAAEPTGRAEQKASPGGARGLKAAAVSVDHDASADVFTLTADVQVKDPPRFGVNVASGAFKPWGNGQLFNIWNASASFEPIVMRHSQLLAGGGQYGPDFIDENWQGGNYEPRRAGVSWYGGFPDGIWNGADLRIYRTDGKRGYRLVHRTKVKNYRCHCDRSKDMKDDARIEFETAMDASVAPCRENDFIVLTQVVNEVPAPAEARFEDMKNDFMKTVEGARRTLDASTKCPEGGSTASLKLTLPGSETPAGIAHPYLRKVADPNDLGWLRLRKGQPYKCQVWLRQEGLEGGEVVVQVGTLVTKTLSVSGEWHKFEFDVPNDETLLTDQPAALRVGSTKKGTLWVDNLLVWQSNWPPFALHETPLQVLKDYRPGTIRIWVPLHAGTLDCALSQKFQELDRWSTRRMEGTTGCSLPQMLDICEQVGADPWLILYPGMDDEECARLMEYLCAPADAGYGKRRAADGHPRPWSDVFGRMYFECANEAWNGSFAPLAYSGRPETYGQIAQHQFAQLKASPFYRKGRDTMVASGWSSSIYRRRGRDGSLMMEDKAKQWGLSVMENCPDADVLDVAFYYGGADGLTVLGDNDKDLFTSQLMYGARVVEPALEDTALLRGEIKERFGRDIGFAVYEGGPGYAIPGPGRTFVDVSETVGKSLAMGILTLDAYMHNLADGYLSNSYFTFKTGYNWAVYKDDNDPVIYPSWMGLALRNVYCAGDLMKVEPTDVKTVSFSEEVAEKLNWKGDEKVKRTIPARANIPLTLCYAFRDGKRHAVLAINRSYDEPRSVKLNLPYAPAAAVEIVKLTHPDPRVSNRFEWNVRTQTEQRSDFANGYVFTLPPSSAFVLINGEK